MQLQSARVRFPNSGDEFYAELKRRVSAHFESAGISPRDPVSMYAKTAVLLLWLFVSYALLMFWASRWWQCLPLCLSMGFAAAGIGFSVMHDGNHGGYSRSKLVNRIMAMTLDMLGGSSYIWTWKHNVLHHTYPNIVGFDSDIDIVPLSRMAPTHPSYDLHRYQHIYMWGMYGLLAMKWNFLDDFHDLIVGEIGGQRFPRPKGWELFAMLAGKAVFYFWVLILPMMLHPIWAVVVLYLIGSFALSVTLAITFQLAHCVSQASFPAAPAQGQQMTTGWAHHQLLTTVDFARDNRVLSWYMGGLNFQIEHHLFPKICHIHYPAISPVVEATCRDFGVPFQVNRTLREALASHSRWLRQMGHPLDLPSQTA